MGRKKKNSVRCKTSKREHKHKKFEQQKKILKSPVPNKKRVSLNKIIDSNGKSSEFIHSKLVRQNKSRKTPTKNTKIVTISPENKLKIDTFLFGKTKSRSSKRLNKNKKDQDNDQLMDNKSDRKSRNNNNKSNSIEEIDEEEDVEKFDILQISNLDKRVNEKIMAKIINKKLSQMQVTNTQQISLKSISILTISKIKSAKIKLKKLSTDNTNPLTLDIIKLLNGKKLFGKILKCEAVTK